MKKERKWMGMRYQAEKSKEEKIVSYSDSLGSSLQDEDEGREKETNDILLLLSIWH
jgi:hypothetical protein